MLKRLITILLFLPVAVLPAAAQSANPESKAKDFVQQGVERAIAILDETAPDDPARAARFRDFVNDIIDTRSIALFALGHYRKGLSPDVLKAYVHSFEAYATASYESRLGEYGGQTISIINGTARNDTDVLISGTIHAADGQEITDIAFRVLTTKHGLQLFDVRVSGIWLAVEQRNQFGAWLAQHNGDVQQLIDFLVSETARMRSGGATVAAMEG